MSRSLEFSPFKPWTWFVIRWDRVPTVVSLISLKHPQQKESALEPYFALTKRWEYSLKRSFQLKKKSRLKYNSNECFKSKNANWCTLQSISKIDHCSIMWCVYVLFGIILVTPVRGIERNKTGLLTGEKATWFVWGDCSFFWLESYRPISITPMQSCSVRYTVAGNSSK